MVQKQISEKNNQSNNGEGGSSSNQPVFKVGDSSLQIACWLNKKDFNGVERLVPSLTLRKSWPVQGKEGQFEERKMTLDSRELAKLIVVAGEAQRTLVLKTY